MRGPTCSRRTCCRLAVKILWKRSSRRNFGKNSLDRLCPNEKRRDPSTAQDHSRSEWSHSVQDDSRLGCCFVRVREAQNRRLGEVFAEDLHADRQLLFGAADRD